jgi:hypothetical protein
LDGSGVVSIRCRVAPAVRYACTVALLTLALVAGFPAAADASVGVGVQGVPVRLAGAARAGSHYRLPSVYVVNTGTQTEAISVKVERLSPGSGRVVPASWVKVLGPTPRLRAHEAGHLALELLVPSGAVSGACMSDVVVDGSAAITVGRTNLGVAAATKIEFAVLPGAGKGLFPRVPPWTWGAGGGAVLLALVIAAMRRAGIRVRVERSAACAVTGPPAARHNAAWRGLRPAAGLGVVAALMALAVPPALASTSVSGSTTATLASVLTTRSIKVTPTTTAFGDCKGGTAPTASTSTALGYPNGSCSVGVPGSAGVFPITITNTGIAGDIDISSSNATPSDNGDRWILCSSAPAAATPCSSAGSPGGNQFTAENFSLGKESGSLTRTPTCDPVFDRGGGCAAAEGQSASEGVALIGPLWSSDISRSWTLTFTWITVAT